MDSDNKPSRFPRYQETLRIYGESPKSLRWINYRSQAIRFKNLIRDIEPDGKSILDAGCGMGDLLPFLYAKADNFSYLGVDINPDFINIAKRRYYGHEFRVLDPFNGGIAQSFDIVLSSGVMNYNIPNWLEERKKMIKNLFVLTNEKLAFNMAGAKDKIPDTPDIAYASMQDIIDFCLTLTPKVKYWADYHPKDFTVTLYK